MAHASFAQFSLRQVSLRPPNNNNSDITIESRIETSFGVNNRAKRLKTHLNQSLIPGMLVEIVSATDRARIAPQVWSRSA